MATRQAPGEYRTSDGAYYRVVGDGEPLLLLHGLLATGAMFDPLVDLLKNRFCMIVPDLRGHGKSGNLAGPYDVPGLSADLELLLSESGHEQCSVLGYSHGGAVAQQFAYKSSARVTRMMLACTYACNVATTRERIEASALAFLLGFLSPKTIVNLVISPSATGLTREQADWLRALMSVNQSSAMRGAARGLITFDSRPWLGEIEVPTLVIGGTDDVAVPRYHFDTLVEGIPNAKGQLVEHAGHTLIWTHTQQLADIVQKEW